MRTLRITLNISEEVLKDVEALYNTKNRSKAVEEALKEAIRISKIKKLKELKGDSTASTHFAKPRCNQRHLALHLV